MQMLFHKNHIFDTQLSHRCFQLVLMWLHINAKAFGCLEKLHKRPILRSSLDDDLCGSLLSDYIKRSLISVK